MTLLTYEQVARELNVSKRTVERLVADGDLEVVEVVGARRFTQEAIDRFVAASAVTRVRERPGLTAARASRGPSSFRQELRAVS